MNLKKLAICWALSIACSFGTHYAPGSGTPNGATAPEIILGLITIGLFVMGIILALPAKMFEDR